MVAKYSAGITSVRLWFKEFKQCLELYHEGYTIVEIKQAKPAELRLATTLRSISSLEMSIVFNQVEATSDTVTKQEYRVFFEDADG